MNADQILASFQSRKQSGRPHVTNSRLPCPQRVQTIEVAPCRPIVSILQDLGLDDPKFQEHIEAEGKRYSGELAVPFSLIDSSVSLFDKFEQGAYKRLVLENALMSRVKSGALFSFDLLIERLYTLERSRGNVTMSELRKGEVFEFEIFLHTSLERGMSQGEHKQGDVVLFDEPYQLRAQTSGHRYYPGGYFKYGDTRKYGVVGVRLS